MAASTGTLNLSLLSRGVGEVSTNGHEKVDVVFEPQDYFNFVGHNRPFFLPPIHPQYAYESSPRISTVRNGSKEKVYLPKTFTTRKGALLLFSEDMAHRTKQTEAKRRKMASSFDEDEEYEYSADDKDLKTVDDLAKSILSYGNHGDNVPINLKFIHSRRRDYFDRQIRPGFSAKRYLSTWTKSWDDSVLEKVISKGYLTEKSLFYYNPLLPHLSRRLNDDMSHYPPPYKLMRNMLMSPGSLSGYTFYRVRPESQETDYQTGDDDEDTRTQPRSIKVLSVDRDGAREVNYGSLEPGVKNKVLTDLLVKSAVNYAMKTQEYVAEYMDGTRITEVSESTGTEIQKFPQFDMKDAVETFLQDQKGVPTKQVIEAELPERDDSSQLSGSFKGGKVGQQRQHGTIKERGDILVGMPHKDAGGFPVLPPIGQGGMVALTPIGEASREHTQAMSVPHVERDGDSDSMMPQVNIIPSTPQYSLVASRGFSRDPNLQVPLEMPSDEEEEEKWVGEGMTERDVLAKHQKHAEAEKKRREERRKARIPHQNLDLEAAGPIVSGGAYLMSSSESLGPGSTHSGRQPHPPHRQQWKGSNQSLRSHGSKKGRMRWRSYSYTSNSDLSEIKESLSEVKDTSKSRVKDIKSAGSATEEGSVKGSVIFGPDGEVIKVGGQIQPSMRPSDVVMDVDHANLPTGRDMASEDETDTEMPEEWKVQRQRPLSARKSDSLKRMAQRREIDYTSGDIDATVSMHSWSYGTRDGDASLCKSNSCHSLPNIPLNSEKSSSQEVGDEKEVWESIRHSSFVNIREFDMDIGPPAPYATPLTAFRNTSLSGTSVRANITSPKRSKSDLKMASKTSIGSLQRSRSTPIENERSEDTALRSKSRPISETQKSHRSLQSQLNLIEGETEIIREQTEASFVADADEKLSKVSENVMEGNPKCDTNKMIIDLEVKKPADEPKTSDLEVSKVTEEPEVIEKLQEKPVEKIESKTLENTVIDTEDVDEKEIADDLDSPKEQTVKEEQPREKTPSQLSESPVLSPKPPSRPPSGAPSKAASGRDSPRSQVTEQEIIDTLTEHASRIASSVLSSQNGGTDIETDIRLAASIWMEQHPPRDISRSQSVTEPPDNTVIQEVMNAQKRNSAGPTVAEYRDQIRENLVTAIAKVAGVTKDEIPLNAEIDPGLMEALANSTLNPDDIEIVKDEVSGRSFIRSRKGQIADAMGGVREGHIYLPAAKDGAGRNISIPGERSANADVGEMGVIHYGVQMGDESSSDKVSQASLSYKTPSERAPSEKALSEQGSIKAGSSVRGKSPVKSLVAGSIPEEAGGDVKSQVSAKSSVSFKEAEADEFKKAVAELEQGLSPKKLDTEHSSIKSGKSGSSLKSEDKKSKASSKKPSSPEKKEEFVVGKVRNKKELEELYGQPVDVPPKAEPLPDVPKMVKEVKPKPGKKKEKSVKNKTVAKASAQSMSTTTASLKSSEEAGAVDHMEENKKLYGIPPNLLSKGKPKEKKPKAPPAGKKEGPKKGKKGTKKGKATKKEEPVIAEPPPEESALLPQEPSPELVKAEPPKKPPTPEEERYESPEFVRSESEESFRIIREQTPSPEPVIETKPPVVTTPDTEPDEEQSLTRQSSSSTRGSKEEPDTEDMAQNQEIENSEADKLRMISNREARAAKRAAAAEKRRQEVERKRKEREEQQKKEKEEQERQDKLKQELEEQRLRKEEERRIELTEQERLKRQQEEAMKAAQMSEEMERERRKQQEIEREKRMKEEYARKLEEMKKKQAEEEKKRQEELKRKAEEEEQRRLEEEALMATMAEQERIEYERRKKEEEEERIRKEEEEKRRREEEAQRAMEEARRLAEEMARKQAEMEARLRFNRTLQLESNGLEHTQDINKAFVFSYFELLQWLGLDIPEFELLKLNQY